MLCGASAATLDSSRRYSVISCCLKYLVEGGGERRRGGCQGGGGGVGRTLREGRQGRKGCR